MSFQIGDKVKVISETSTGKIVDFFGVFFMVEIDGLEYQYRKEDLILFEENCNLKNIVIHPAQIAHKEREHLERKPKKKTIHQLFVKEVDLHIDDKHYAYKNFSNGNFLHLQLNRFRQELDKAIYKKLDRIVFIHGVGEGVLREEILSILRSYPNVSYQPGPSKKYGNGATEVLIQ